MNRNFDMEIVTKDSDKILFSGIEWAESENLISFLNSVGLKV